MNSSQFNNIFFRPLHNDKIPLHKIDESTYDEIIYLSNKFLLSSEILNNILNKGNRSNALLRGLNELSNISNLKILINQNELIKIAKVFNENNINYAFLKGSAINLLSNKYIRCSRDIDVIVNKSSLTKAYNLLKDIGYSYKDKLVSDKTKYIKYSHHLPVMSNPEGALVELHHRITDFAFYEECPLTKLILDDYSSVKKSGIDIKICRLEYLIAHIIYHASLHHEFNQGPIFLYDIKHLRGMLKNEKNLIILLNQMGINEEYNKIVEVIENKIIKDYFGLYENAKTQQYYKKNPIRLSYLVLTKKGRTTFFKNLLKKFKTNEDLYQTSKYSLKFYFIFLVQFKNYISRLLRSNGRDGRI